MKTKQTGNHKKLKDSTSIGSGSRTTGLTSRRRVSKKRSTISPLKRTSKKTGNRTASQSKGCSGCSRSSRG